MSAGKQDYFNEIQRTLNNDHAYLEWLDTLDSFNRKYNRATKNGCENTLNTGNTTKEEKAA